MAGYGTCDTCRNYVYDEEYEKSLEGKKKEVSKLLEPFFKVTKITGMDDPFFYRNKATCSFGMDRKGHPVSGIYAKDSHRLVDVKDCFIEDKKARAVIKTVRELNFVAFVLPG